MYDGLAASQAEAEDAGLRCYLAQGIGIALGAGADMQDLRSVVGRRSRSAKYSWAPAVWPWAPEGFDRAMLLHEGISESAVPLSAAVVMSAIPLTACSREDDHM